MAKVDNFFEILDTRRTVREFTSDKLEDKEIERIIESARVAPSAVNAQNWKFVAILNDEIKEKMASAVVEKYTEISEKLDDTNLKTGIQKFIHHSTFFKLAPLVIVAIMTPAPKFLEGILEKAGYEQEEIASMRPDSQLLSMGGAIENILLTCHAIGFGACWMVAPVLAQKAFSKILNLNEDDKIVSILAVGKSANSLEHRSSKKNLNEIMEIIR